jgi:hypothetical protein
MQATKVAEAAFAAKKLNAAPECVNVTTIILEKTIKPAQRIQGKDDTCAKNA